MDILTSVIIAFGLAMDAFAVSIAKGVIIKEKLFRQALRFGLFFGLFQMGMPLVGWSAGLPVRHFIEHVDHWIAFVLLCLVGGKLIYEAFRPRDIESCGIQVSTQTLLCLAVATSIDALAVGISLAFIDYPIVQTSIIIGVLTFVLSFLGVFIGNRFGHIFEEKVEIIGGLILIGIGFKILAQHLGWHFF